MSERLITHLRHVALGVPDFETEVDTAVLGDGAFKVTWDEREQRVVVTAPDVQGLFAWWVGDDVRRLSRVASRYRLPADETVARLGHAPRTIGGRTPSTVEVVEVWTADTFELWLQKVRVEARTNPYGDIPFVLYPNLPAAKAVLGDLRHRAAARADRRAEHDEVERRRDHRRDDALQQRAHGARHLELVDRANGVEIHCWCTRLTKISSSELWVVLRSLKRTPASVRSFSSAVMPVRSPLVS